MAHALIWNRIASRAIVQWRHQNLSKLSDLLFSDGLFLVYKLNESNSGLWPDLDPDLWLLPQPGSRPDVITTNFDEMMIFNSFIESTDRERRHKMSQNPLGLAAVMAMSNRLSEQTPMVSHTLLSSMLPIELSRLEIQTKKLKPVYGFTDTLFGRTDAHIEEYHSAGSIISPIFHGKRMSIRTLGDIRQPPRSASRPDTTLLRISISDNVTDEQEAEFMAALESTIGKVMLHRVEDDAAQTHSAV